MSRLTLSGWLVLSAVVVSAAFAPTPGDRDREGDSAKPGGVANAANNAAAPANAGANPAPPKKKKSLDQELVTALYRVGLQSEGLAAAGVSAQAVSAVVSGVKTWRGQNPTAVSDADTRLANAAISRDALLRKVQSGLGSKDDV